MLTALQRIVPDGFSEIIINAENLMLGVTISTPPVLDVIKITSNTPIAIIKRGIKSAPKRIKHYAVVLVK